MYELIEKLCKEKGISPTSLCVQITGSRGNLPTWKKGNINPVSLTKIADYFNVSVDYLLGRTENPNLNTEINIGNNNMNNNSVNIQTASNNDIKEITELMKGLSLVQRSKVIVMIDEMKKEE